MKSLSEAVEPDAETLGVDKNSDSGVMTEGDSEQSNPNNKTTRTAEVHNLSQLFYLIYNEYFRTSEDCRQPLKISTKN